MAALAGGQVHPGGDAPPAPEGLQRQGVAFEGLPEPPRQEWFLEGSAMDRVAYEPGGTPRIRYPAPDTVVALDPDIPAGRQVLRFRAEAGEAGVSWWLDGRRLGPARDRDWTPSPGAHRLELRDAAGHALDGVFFTVRGRAATR